VNSPVSVKNAEHYVWGEACDGWHLLRRNGLSVIEERMPPGTREQRHLHIRSRQFFYVIVGALTMELSGQHYLLTAGTGLEIAPSEPHQALNKSDKEVRFIVISQPPSHEDRQPV
jgi:mannose-6-phosphate isomerase-like protein (cupin superfamily)